jgi:hypothetical protein
MADNFYPSAADRDPVTNRLYRDSWARQQRSFKPSQHIHYDAVERSVRDDPAANATAAEIKQLIVALEAHYRELGEKLITRERHAHEMRRIPISAGSNG